VIGNGLATLFASVGPCFLLPIHGDAHFVPLMNALQEANRHFPVLTLDVQQRLMEMQHAKRNLLGAGISAMPSVHVHFALLFALWGMKVSKRAGAAFAAFFIVICIGSVATGYHYAVDGYLAIAITLIIWWATGRLFREAPKAI
jgi:membrane-associated phospholipid phosphatase